MAALLFSELALHELVERLFFLGLELNFAVFLIVVHIARFAFSFGISSHIDMLTLGGFLVEAANKVVALLAEALGVVVKFCMLALVLSDDFPPLFFALLCLIL